MLIWTQGLALGLLFNDRHRGPVVTQQLAVLSKTLAVTLTCLASTGNAIADSKFSAGYAGEEQLRPFIAFDLNEVWSHSNWNHTSAVYGRLQPFDGLGDASLQTVWHGQTNLADSLRLELDADYQFNRERDLEEAIKQTHTLTGDFGLEFAFDTVTLKADAGVVAKLHQPTTQKGYPALGRKKEDYHATEVALRWTLTEPDHYQPFVEVAYQRRDYLIDTDRNFSGPELVVGATLAGKYWSGDAGLIYASRDLEHGKSTEVLGPYFDLNWTLGNGTAFSLAMSAGIDQDTSGPADLFGFHSMRLEVSKQATEKLNLSMLLDAIREDHNSGAEIELNPKFKFSLQYGENVNLFGSAGLTLGKVQSAPMTTDPLFELGMSWQWKPPSLK